MLTAQDWHVVGVGRGADHQEPTGDPPPSWRAPCGPGNGFACRVPRCENHLGELWSLFDFLLPGFLGDRKQFGWRYRGPIEKAGNTERQTLLAQRVAPFLLRRTKETGGR